MLEIPNASLPLLGAELCLDPFLHLENWFVNLKMPFGYPGVLVRCE